MNELPSFPLIDRVFIHAELSPVNRLVSARRHRSQTDPSIGDVAVLQGRTGIVGLDGYFRLIPNHPRLIHIKDPVLPPPWQSV
jgi:hypothetical protein